MKIEVEHKGRRTVLRLEGRLDVVWAEHVAARAQDLLRSGHHDLRLEASGLSYLSSAGLRVLIQLRRDVAAVQGSFFVVAPSEFVDKALRMAGLDALIEAAGTDADESALRAAAPVRRSVATVAGMELEVYPLATGGGMVLSGMSGGTPGQPVKDSDWKALALPEGKVALGIGAAGTDMDEVRLRLGEYLAVAGCMVVQPSDSEQHLPDFVEQTGGFVPEIHAIQALVAEGSFTTLVRFRPAGEAGSISMADLAACALEATGGDAAVWVALGEAEGLVGTALARSPGRIAAGEEPGSFPQIREWMNFCGERVHAGRSVLVVGFVARRPEGKSEDPPWLAPLPSRPELAVHVHAAVFPFRPLPEGEIRMEEHVRALFDARGPLDLLHLVEDDRPLIGLGQSALIRGACWCARLADAQGGVP